MGACYDAQKGNSPCLKFDENAIKAGTLFYCCGIEKEFHIAESQDLARYGSGQIRLSFQRKAVQQMRFRPLRGEGDLNREFDF